MQLITTIEQVQATGLRISNIDRGGRLPDMEFAQREYLQPHLGDALLAACESDTPSLEIQALLPYVRKALAPFAYWNDLPHLHSKITDAGVRRTTTDNAPAAYRWEYEEARNYLEERAHAMLEECLRFLSENESDYPEWTNNEEAYGRRHLTLIKSGKELNKYYRLHQPYRTYNQLHPNMLNIERMYLEPMIGKAFLQTFRDGGVLDADELQAAELMKHAIAQLTIYEASCTLPCTVTASGFMVRMQPGAGENGVGRDGQVPASSTVLHQAAQAALANGKKNLAALRKYLNTKASATVFADYFESTYYSADNTPITNRKNDIRKTFRF